MTPEAMRERVACCLGGPWPESCDLRPVWRETMPRDGYRIESVTYETEPGEPVPAYLLIPDGVDATHPAPAVAVWHQHAGQYHIGKSEPAGLAGDPMHHTGVTLVRHGYVVLCPDALCFEERRDMQLDAAAPGRHERFAFCTYVVDGKSLAWKSILDMRRAVDYLCSRPEVDAARLGCYGHSMGATHTWLVGPWEPRLRCFVANCCLPTYEAIHACKLLHCFPNFIPGLHAFGDTPDVVALIAPRPLHLNFGERDSGSPIQFVRQALSRIQAAYATAGSTENFTSYIERGSGHILSPEMERLVLETFARHLR